MLLYRYRMCMAKLADLNPRGVWTPADSNHRGDLPPPRVQIPRFLGQVGFFGPWVRTCQKAARTNSEHHLWRTKRATVRLGCFDLPQWDYRTFQLLGGTCRSGRPLIALSIRPGPAGCFRGFGDMLQVSNMCRYDGILGSPHSHKFYADQDGQRVSLRCSDQDICKRRGDVPLPSVWANHADGVSFSPR